MNILRSVHGETFFIQLHQEKIQKKERKRERAREREKERGRNRQGGRKREEWVLEEVFSKLSDSFPGSFFDLI